MSGENYTPAQLALVAAVSGVRGHDSGVTDGSKPGNLDIAVAIALAESGGTNYPVGTKDLNKPHAGCSSVGPWQINYCPDRDAKGSARDPAKSSDVFGNGAAMFQISSGGTAWHAWSTYSSGAYKKYLGAAWAGVETYKETPTGGDTHNLAIFGDATDIGGAATGSDLDPTGGAITNTVDNAGHIIAGAAGAVTDPLQAILGVFNFLGNKHNWLRVAVFIGGGTLMIVGGVMVMRTEVETVAEGAAVAAAV